MCAWRVPQGSDLRVLEHGSNCLATVGADVVEGETTSDRRSGVVREQACQWALTVHESEHYGAAAHLRWVICVSLRTAASAEAPSAPMSLFLRLRAR